MTKVSDSAKSELNKLARKFFCLFITICFFYFTGVFNELAFMIMLAIAFFVFACNGKRDKIIKDNKYDVNRQQAIKDYCDSLDSMKLTEINENWINRDFTTARFAKKDEISEIKADYFLYEFLLNRQGGSGLIFQDIKASYQFGLSSNIVKIDKINCLAFLPDPDATRGLLNQIIDFIYFGYLRPRAHMSDYTLEQIISVRKNINKNIEKNISKNYKKIFQILFSGESFRIAGKIIRNENGKKLLLITAVNTEKEHIVLLPEKTIVNIFENLNNICLKNMH